MRNGSTIQTTFGFCRGSQFCSQAPMSGMSQAHIIPFTGNMTSSSGFQGYRHSHAYTHRLTHSHIHIHIPHTHISCIHTHITHIHRHTHSYTTHIHTYHTHIHIPHTQTHTQTHTHTHTHQPPFSVEDPSVVTLMSSAIPLD